ncbi:hypothetical protein COF80_22670 [Bacillus toyonensis]|uniref:hypothetical protein n=1 Tax=Bacillus toyonensis TaxID=155322 RepID=UPI000BFC0AB4|nr:hypothetical protein [Bacillus toyonensis]PHE83683.1 hypothetical protein COF80_22670 [Bacillus toyonensis]
MNKDTLKNVFHMYCFYIVRFQDDTEPRISRNKLVFDNHILSYHENFRDCLVAFYELRDDESLHSFYQFIVNAVNSLNKQERILVYERYLHKDHYKSDRQHYLAMDITPQNYKKQMDPARSKLIKNFGIEDLQLNIPDWMKR